MRSHTDADFVPDDSRELPLTGTSNGLPISVPLGSDHVKSSRVQVVLQLADRVLAGVDGASTGEQPGATTPGVGLETPRQAAAFYRERRASGSQNT
jgi:hypothetical protein